LNSQGWRGPSDCAGARDRTAAALYRQRRRIEVRRGARCNRHTLLRLVVRREGHGSTSKDERVAIPRRLIGRERRRRGRERDWRRRTSTDRNDIRRVDRGAELQVKSARNR